MCSSVWANPKGPVFWHYPGPQGNAIQAALLTERTRDDAQHLLASKEVRAYLKTVQFPDSPGCLDDSAICAQRPQAVLQALGFSARVDARATRTDAGYTATFVMTLASGNKAKTFTGEGSDLEEASRAAFNALRGQGTLVLELTPADASFRIDGRPYGQGNGRYIVSAGRRVIQIEAPKYRMLEETLEIQPKTTTTLKAQLKPAFARVSVVTEPSQSRVFLDGERWENPQKLRDVEPGKHTLRIEAKGHRTFNRDVEFKPAVEHALNLKLVPKEARWRQALRTPHEDTQTHAWTLKASLGGVSLRDGTLGVDAGSEKTFATQDDSAGLLDLSLDLGYRSDHWIFLVGGISFQLGGADTEAKIETIGAPVTLTDVGRTILRGGWTGVRYSLWRIEAYAMGGVALALETFDGKLNDAYSGSKIRPLLGADFGVNYHFDAHLFAGTSGRIEFGFDGRPAAAFLVSGGWAFNPEGWF